MLSIKRRVRGGNKRLARKSFMGLLFCLFFNFLFTLGPTSFFISDVFAQAIETDTTPPSTPYALSGKAESSTETFLSWLPAYDDVGVAGYYVYRNNNRIATVYDTTFFDSGLTAATTYYYKVTAFDAANNESVFTPNSIIQTRSIMPIPDRTPPNRPAGIYAFPAGVDRVDVSWIPANDVRRSIDEVSSGIAGYQVFRDGQLIASVNCPFYSDIGLTPQTSYSYSVASVDGSGLVSATSNAVLNSVTTSMAPSPLSVTIVSPFEGQILSGVVRLEVNVNSSSGSIPKILMTTIDGDLFGGDNQSLPYVRKIYSENLANGQHIIRVYATDDQGAAGYAEVIVSIQNDPFAPDPEVIFPAFPGAEGFGAGASGGRGGDVVYVTNLNASGLGSLNAALAMNESRYVLFKVSGLIDNAARIVNGNLTYAGHTSPGGVIMRGIFAENRNNPEENRDNMILRHIRSRPNQLVDDAFRIGYARNVIIDHGSFGRANDECGQIMADCRYTIQNSIFAETIGGHFIYGGILLKYFTPEYPLDQVTMHHNLFTRLGGRFPQISPNDYVSDWNDSNGISFHFPMKVEVSNNLYWDIYSSMTVGGGSAVAPYQLPDYVDFRLNYLNNYMFLKPEKVFGLMNRMADKSYLQPIHMSGNIINTSILTDYQLIGNNGIGRYEHPLDAGFMGPIDSNTERHQYPAITLDEPEELPTKMSQSVGAFPRDVMDLRLTHYVAAGTIDPSNMWGVIQEADGTLTPTSSNMANTGAGINPVDQEVTDLLTGQRMQLRAGELVDDAFFVTWATPPVPPLDSDDDGMPDWWEVYNGLNPLTQDHNGKTLSVRYTGLGGYDNLEVYLNRLSDYYTNNASLVEGAAYNWPVSIVSTSVSDSSITLGEATPVTFTVTPADADQVSHVELSLANLSDPYASPAPAPVTAIRSDSSWTYDYMIPADLDPGFYKVLVHVVDTSNRHGFALIDLSISAREDSQAPGVPQNLSAMVDSETQVSLSWAASDDNVGVTGYRVYRDGEEVATSMINSYINAGLTANTAYSYTVLAFDAAGNESAQSTSVIVTTWTSNQAPVITPISPITKHEGELVQFNIDVLDANVNDTITLSAENLPTGSTIDQTWDRIWQFNWQTNFQLAGFYTVTFIANDGELNSSPLTVELSINDVDTLTNLTDKPEWFKGN